MKNSVTVQVIKSAQRFFLSDVNFNGSDVLLDSHDVQLVSDKNFMILIHIDFYNFSIQKREKVI